MLELGQQYQAIFSVKAAAKVRSNPSVSDVTVESLRQPEGD